MEDYCKAIAETRLPRSPRVCFYDKERFCELIDRDIDMRDLSQHMADFSQGAGVAQALHSIRGDLQLGIPQKLGYGVSLFQIGSFYDGSKTGRLDEMDCLYVVNEADVVVEQVCPGKGHFKVYVKNTEVKPRDMNKKLISAMRDILSEMILPDGWTHGGYHTKEFSGVRCSGPAVTAMFCNKDENHISLDVSIAFPLTDRLQKATDFPQLLKDYCQSLTAVVADIQSEIPRTAIAPTDLHLIGNLVDNTWQSTTALAEAEILRALITDYSVKESLDICKVLSSKLQTLYKENNTWSEGLTHQGGDQVLAKTSEALKRLRTYKEAEPDSKAQLAGNLNTDMVFQHIWLSENDRKDYKEVLKSDASINTAAIKHIILKTALQIKGAFSGRNKTYTDCLVRAVFEELSDPGSFYTPHAFLGGVELAKFSLSATLSHIKDDIAQDLQEQSRLILDHGLHKVWEAYGTLRNATQRNATQRVGGPLR